MTLCRSENKYRYVKAIYYYYKYISLGLFLIFNTSLRWVCQHSQEGHIQVHIWNVDFANTTKVPEESLTWLWASKERRRSPFQLHFTTAESERFCLTNRGKGTSHRFWCVRPVCSPGVLLFDGQFGPSHLPTADHVPTLRWPRPGLQPQLLAPQGALWIGRQGGTRCLLWPVRLTLQLLFLLLSETRRGVSGTDPFQIQ